MSNKILILFAHPRFEQSRSNQVLVDSIPDHPNITFNDLYEHYADFNVDIEREKQLLLNHDIIVWHHPLYWYSSPPLLKQWIDMVLEFGWAYGVGGDALAGKMVFNAFTSGGPREVYRPEGRNRYTIQDFFHPFEQTVRLCKMEYLPPFGVQGTHRLTDAELQSFGRDYAHLLTRLADGDFSVEAMQQHAFMNDWLNLQKTTNP
jgi:glutathione-regulated potassium-efflux system ancillary protein KefG